MNEYRYVSSEEKVSQILGSLPASQRKYAKVIKRNKNHTDAVLNKLASSKDRLVYQADEYLVIVDLTAAKVEEVIEKTESTGEDGMTIVDTDTRKKMLNDIENSRSNYSDDF